MSGEVGVCSTCKQKVGELDKYDSSGKTMVRWTRFRVNKTTNDKEPEGHECYGCEAREGWVDGVIIKNDN